MSNESSRWIRSALAVLHVVMLLALLTGPARGQDTAAPAFRVEASVDQSAPFVGQQVVHSVRFYAQRMPAREDYLYMDPDGAGLWRGEQFITDRPAVLEGAQYTIRTYETLVYPLQPGPLTISSVQLIIPQTVFSDRVELTSNSVSINVQPLPAGAPASFTGGVGRFQVEARAATAVITIGQPLTLRWTVTGDGNLAQIGQPALILPPVWRAYADPVPTTFTTRGAGERIFEWRLIAEQAGTQTIPAQSFSYFDPDAVQYVMLDVPEIIIDVLPDAAGRRELPSASSRDAGEKNRPAVLPLKPVISPAASRGPILPLWVWAVPPMAVLMTMGGQVFVRERQDRERMRRQNRALSYAKAGLQAAGRSSGPTVFSQVMAVIVTYTADISDRDVRGTLYAEVDEILFSREIPSELREALALCWLEAEEGRFAPAEVVGAVDAGRLIRRTAAVLAAIDAQWKPLPDEEYEAE